jgi:hypothetical protein
MNKKFQTFTIISLAMLIFMLGGIAARYAPVSEFLEAVSSIVYLPFISNDFQTTQDVTRNTLYVFSTTATTNGNGGGRSGMGAVCIAEDPESHFCTRDEITNALLTTGVVFENPFPESWLDQVTQTVGHSWADSENCFGWSATDSASGWVILSNAQNTGGPVCTSTRPVACCKWVP